MEFLIGSLVGFIVGIAFRDWCIRQELESKAETGIDMYHWGRFYTVRRNKDRE